MKTRNRGTKGFTLIEVLMVIVIIGMLAGALVVWVIPARDKAKIDTTKILIQQVADSLERYNNDIGHYPSEDEGGLAALRTKPTFDNERLTSKWAGPYLKKTPRDSWDNELTYEIVDNAAEEGLLVPFKLVSKGPDGEEGTDDDITNAEEEDDGTA